MEIETWSTLLGIEEKEYQKIELFPLEAAPNSFEEFLIKSRIHTFLKLHILVEYEDTVFVPALEEYGLYTVTGHEDDSDGYPEEIWELAKEYGPTIIQQDVTGNEVFSDLLGRLGVLAIEAPEFTEYTGERKAAEEIDTSLGREQVRIYPEWFVAKDGSLIIGNEDIFVVENADKIKGIVEAHREKFTEFVKEYKDSGVPHEIYIEWLQTWFPGKVRVRSLPEKV